MIVQNRRGDEDTVSEGMKGISRNGKWQCIFSKKYEKYVFTSPAVSEMSSIVTLGLSKGLKYGFGFSIY
jgi:hypothetical protein